LILIFIKYPKQYDNKMNYRPWAYDPL